MTFDQSRWVFMTKNILSESRDKSYEHQQRMITDLMKQNLHGYEVLELFESVVRILSQYLIDSQTRLFVDDPATYTRCKEKVLPAEHIYEQQMIVGVFYSIGSYYRKPGFRRRLYWYCSYARVLKPLDFESFVLGSFNSRKSWWDLRDLKQIGIYPFYFSLFINKNFNVTN